MNQQQRRRIVPDFGLALVLLGCCERAAHLATVKTKTARLPLTVANNRPKETGGIAHPRSTFWGN
jgi:hypothetical protein